MSFFIRPQAYHAQPTFNPLLDLLREASRDSCQPKQRPVKTFTPKFDITETATAYELYGELPGVEQKEVEIKFTDRQTLTISGHRERQTPTTISQAAPTSPSPAPAAAEESRKASVEDDFEEVNASDSDTTTSTAQNTETTSTEKVAEKKPEEPKPRYWVTERGVGQFSRSFEFQEGIDQQGVQASLKNGVLSVIVPKKPFEARKIEIN